MPRNRRRRYELRDSALNARLEALVAEAAAALGGTGTAPEDARQLVVTALRLLEDGASEGDLKLLNAAMKELRHALRVFAPYEHVRKVAVFGSARTPEDHPDWRQAFGFAERMVADGWMVITGAGEGIMGAAQGGAGREASFGVNIRLPFEQQANEVIAGDSKLINFRYFFTRKVTFVKEAHAIALFPGGFGTHDEGFEALTLIQTGKSEILPVVFVDAPGGTYWKAWRAFVETQLVGRGLVAPEDLALFHITDDVGDAVGEITRFYRNYHSSRWVGSRLVLRVQRAPTPEELATLSAHYADILTEGGLETGPALPEEEGDVDHLPRILLRFDRRSVGRLRMLIDELNALPGAAPEEPASPRQIPAAPMSREAERDEDLV
jgi:uncharacterized protein (TIGR00730 family)